MGDNEMREPETEGIEKKEVSDGIEITEDTEVSAVAEPDVEVGGAYGSAENSEQAVSAGIDADAAEGNAAESTAVEDDTVKENVTEEGAAGEGSSEGDRAGEGSAEEAGESISEEAGADESSSEDALEERKRTPFSVSKKKLILGTAAAVVLVAAAGAGFYTYEAQQYKRAFFPNTVVNGVDVSGKTIEQVKELVSEDVENYVLNISGRGGLTDTITNDEIELHMVFDNSLDRYLAAQKPMEWWKHRSTVANYQVNTALSLDEQLLSDRIDGLVFFDESRIQPPQDAYLSDYIVGEGYKVVPEEQGNKADKAAVSAAVAEAIQGLKPELALEKLDVYDKPEITLDDADLNAQAESLNKFVKSVITYQFGSQEEVLNGDTIVNWMITGEDGVVTIDPEQVSAYVAGLAEKYNTAGKPKALKTTSGEVVTISKGTYGWKIDQKKEADQLYELVMAGESQTREPVYSQTANSRGDNDYGNTYVEVNLSAQHLYYYKDGKLVIESDFVSGNHSRGYDTPSGAYFVAYKQRNRVLRGERRPDGSYEYESPVSYWMPFNGGIGLHDATWRGAFGGKIYLTNGSHGCVNLPKSVAKTIYENIAAGTPVLCYQTGGSSGTAAASAGSSGSKTTSAAKPAAATVKPAAPSAPTAAQPAVPETAAPAPQTVPEETSGAEAGPGVSAGEPGPGAESQAPAGPGEVGNVPDEGSQEVGPGVSNGGGSAPAPEMPAPESAPAPEPTPVSEPTPAPAAPAPEAPAPGVEAQAPAGPGQ